MKAVHLLPVVCMDSGKSETRCKGEFPMSIDFAKDYQGSVQRQLDGFGVSVSLEDLLSHQNEFRENHNVQHLRVSPI